MVTRRQRAPYRSTFMTCFSKVCDLGMMLTILSNGSRLSSSKILDLITFRYPHRITLSVYGASAESYDGLTRRKGAFKMFEKGPCTPDYH